MKIAVIGSREYPNLGEVHNFIINEFQHGDILVSGGAPGVDTEAENTADAHHLGKIIKRADWTKHGDIAGFLRNREIVKEADRVVAFWNGRSSGTAHSIELAEKSGKPLMVFRA
jgi:hypothetical protein